jgi:hypothetical protein
VGQKKQDLTAPLNAAVSNDTGSPTTVNRENSTTTDIEKALALCFLQSPQWQA